MAHTCDRCHQKVGVDDLWVVDGYDLCDTCYEQFKEAFRIFMKWD